MSEKLIALIPQLLEISADAGKAIMEIYQNDADFEVEAKSDDSPLTLADKKSNEIICQRLEKLEQVFPIISEETKLVDYQERKKWEYCWLVDPLDGTKEFIRKNGDFTTNIALVKNGEVILGVVGIPVLKEIYWAIRGNGAYLFKNGTQTKIEAGTFKSSDKGLNMVCSRSHLNEETKAFLENYDTPNLVSRGSALKFLLLAKGEAHIYPRIAPTMEWDTAAAQVILEEAGGEVLVFDTDKPLRYNRENLLNPSFVAKANEIGQ